MDVSARAQGKSLAKFIQEFGLLISETDKDFRFRVPVQKIEELVRQLRASKVAMQAIPISQQGQFLMLVAQWDAFMGSLLRWVYEIKPEVINSSRKTLTFSELKNLGSIEEARSQIIEEEISSVLRESHSAHFDYLEKTLGLKLRENLDIWQTFIELTQRRNLLAHVGGIVSHQYIQVCKENKVLLDPETKLGTKLNVTKEYFSASCECLLELGVKLALVISRKLKPEEIEKFESHFLKTSFDLIVGEQYQPAINLLEFALRPPMKFVETRSRLVATVNLAQAHKWLGSEEKCRALVKLQDWSAASIGFLLAVAVLEDRFDDAKKIMIRIGEKGDVNKAAYDEWPLFKKFRASPQFLSAYQTVFGNETEVKDVPKSAMESTNDTIELSTPKENAPAKRKTSPEKQSAKAPNKRIGSR